MAGLCGRVPSETNLSTFVISLREAGLSEVSCNIYIRSINSFISWLKDKGVCPRTLLNGKEFKIAKLQEQKKVFTEDQVTKILNFQPRGRNERRLFAIILTLLDTGMRIDSCLSWSCCGRCLQLPGRVGIRDARLYRSIREPSASQHGLDDVGSPRAQKAHQKLANGLLLAGRLEPPKNINSTSLVGPIDNLELSRSFRIDAGPSDTSDQWLDCNQFPALPVKFFQESATLIWITIQYINHFIFKSCRLRLPSRQR
jgi:hypothetical protein